MRRALAVLGLAVPLGLAGAQGGAAPSAPAPANLAQQRAQARAQQTELRARLAALQETIAAQDAERRAALAALQASDAQLAEWLGELDALNAKAGAIRSEIERLNTQQAEATAQLAARRQTLAEMLRAHYTGGVSPWMAWLAGADAHTLTLRLGYFSYLSDAQTKVLAQVQASLAQNARVRAETVARGQALQAVQADMQNRVAALQQAQGVQARQLSQLDQALSRRRTQADQILAEVRGLESLLARLEADRARQQQAAAQRQLPAPDAGLNGLTGLAALQGKLPHPVAGAMIGRFGKERPEGGLWRGVVILADAGTPVHAVAAGRVVYAEWLTGLGHLMIVDHGAQFLSVYAYNQSLAQAVGAVVDAGSTLAWVGSTGGQVEPGLYFELRVAGAPVNPRLWLRP